MTEQALEILRQGLDRLGLTYPPDAVERLALRGALEELPEATACWRKTR